MHPRDPRGAGWGADRAVVETVEVTETFLCQLVDVGSLGVLAPVTTDPLDAVVLAGDPKDVRFLFFSGKLKDSC